MGAEVPEVEESLLDPLFENYPSYICYLHLLQDNCAARPCRPTVFNLTESNVISFELWK